MSNTIHKSGKQIFGIRKPSKFNVPEWNEGANELNARYREAVSHWNIAGRHRSGPFAELKCRARATFRHEMKFLRENEDHLHSQSIVLNHLHSQNFKEENAMISGRKLKHSIKRKNPCH